jgi:hypothetical protein
VNPILQPGELAYSYPYGSNTNGLVKIGGPGGSRWSTSTIIFPTSGGGGTGTQGATGPSGTSAFQFVAYEGSPTITSLPEHGYSITINVNSDDVVISANPESFNVVNTGVLFSCTLPSMSGLSSQFIAGFDQAYAVISYSSGNKIQAFIATNSQGSPVSYNTGDILVIQYSYPLVIFKVGSNIIGTYTYSNTTDFAYVGIKSGVVGESITFTNANVYPIGAQGPTGPIGPTGPQGRSYAETVPA